MMMIPDRVLRSALTGLLLLAGVPGPAAGALVLQQPGDRQVLQAAETALEEGRFSEAREGVEAWWAGGEAGRDRQTVQHALWLRARLTVDPEAAELLYRRMVVEFPGGAWSDQALLRLASGAQARDDREAAQRYLQILVRDYPASPFRVQARNELSRLEAQAARPGTGPAPRATEGPAPRAAPPQPTPAAPAAPRADPPPAAAPAPATPPPATGGARQGSFTLQFGAFGESTRARAVAGELQRAGLDARVVQVEGSPLFRVRAEAFVTREEADARAVALRERGFEVIVSPDRERERPVG